MELELRKGKKILVLASYCDDCTDDLPCNECLMINNVATVLQDTPLDIHCGLQYSREFYSGKEIR